MFEIDDLWRNMDIGGFSIGVGVRLLRFNGKLFKQAIALTLTREEIGLLRDASAADWRDLEPAIFGTLFEQVPNPVERRQLGAHLCRARGGRDHYRPNRGCRLFPHRMPISNNAAAS